MGDNKIISKSSIEILGEINDNPGITLTEIHQNIDKSFTSVSRQFREDHGPAFLQEMIKKEKGEDQREKNIWIEEGKEEEVETLVNALEIVRKYEDMHAEHEEEQEETEE